MASVVTKPDRSRILVLGAAGMLGHTMLRYFRECDTVEAYGTIRSATVPDSLAHLPSDSIISSVDALDLARIADLVRQLSITVIVNCVGIVKQRHDAEDPLTAIPINALFPHQLAAIAERSGARLVHISTDCVFSGARGMYTEADLPDALDLYGRSKLLGEVTRGPCITLRTSIIGPELRTSHGLLEWFLAQRGRVQGYRHAVFSGLTTLELSRVIAKYVLPRSSLSGLFHVAAHPITKLDLLKVVADAYATKSQIVAVDTPVIDRSLDAGRFHQATGYTAPSWDALISAMKSFG